MNKVLSFKLKEEEVRLLQNILDTLSKKENKSYGKILLQIIYKGLSELYPTIDCELFHQRTVEQSLDTCILINLYEKHKGNISRISKELNKNCCTVRKYYKKLGLRGKGLKWWIK